MVTRSDRGASLQTPLPRQHALADPLTMARYPAPHSTDGPLVWFSFSPVSSDRLPVSQPLLVIQPLGFRHTSELSCIHCCIQMNKA